jgi:hypothetical protein
MPVNTFLWTGELCCSTAIYSWLHQSTVVNVSAFGRIRQNMALYGTFVTVNDGRLPPYTTRWNTVVIMAFTIAYISVNDDKPSFTIILMLNLDTEQKKIK